MALVAVRKPLLGNLLKSEYAANLGYCREVVTLTVAGGAELSVGSVLGNEAGTYVLRDPAGSDGAEVSAAIVVENKTLADGEATEVAVLVRGPAIVGRNALVFDVAHTPEQEATAIAEIESLGIVVRNQI